MAHAEQLRILLRQGIKAWNAWRQQEPKAQIDLREADLFGADLRSAHLHRADLSEADLRTANLTEADLHGADLVGADLRLTNLYKANLRRAKLSVADLEQADLDGADLRRASLRGAHLHRADLAEADLGGAELDGADFDGASFFQTVLLDVDLSRCKNLDAIEHRGPSFVDISTLQRSGPLPLVFLRGLGLPDKLIDYLPSLLGSAIEFYSCFISYSHDDKVFARRLHDQLQGRGIRCWLDEHQLLPGDDIHEGVDRGIRLWDKVLLCASQSSLTSWWVDGEVNRAFQKEAQLMKERGKKALALIPLNLDGQLFAWENGKADEVRSRLAADFRGWETNNTIFETQLERLVRALRADDGGREAPPPSRL